MIRLGDLAMRRHEELMSRPVREIFGDPAATGYPRTCCGCGREYYAGKRAVRKSYCSDKCRLSQIPRKEVRMGSVKCLHCGIVAPVNPLGKRKKYCSDACRWRAKWDRRRK